MTRQPLLEDGAPRLQAFLRVNFDVLYDWNIKTGAIYFTEQLDKMMGLPARHFPRSLKGWLEHVHPADHDHVRASLSRAVAGDDTFHAEYRLRRADGSYLTVSDQGTILYDAACQPANMIGAMRDVTGQRQAQQARREAD
jgi:PAS domain-containing protein